MPWKFDNMRPVYLQIIERIEARIISGEYPPGERMPSVRELSLEAGVNPNTVQKAFSMLKAKNVLESSRTTGYFTTSDESVIEEIRHQKTDGVTREYVTAMHDLAYNDKQIIATLKNYLTEKNVETE